MKKFLYVALFLIGSAFNTKANNKKFVDFGSNIPSLTNEQKIAYLKAAMTHGTIPGAVVNSYDGNYIIVWGLDLYNEVLSASSSQFLFGTSKGGEPNNGLDQDNNTVPSGSLESGLEIMGLIRPNGEKVILAKTSNLCFNAIGNIQQINPGPTPPQQPTTSTTTTNPPANNNNQQLIVVPQQKTEISYSDGKEIERAGADERELAIVHGMGYAKDLMIAGSNLNSNCCNSGGGNTNTTTTIGQPTVIYTPAPQQGGGGGYYPQQTPFGQTFGGQVLANLIGTTGGNLASDAIEGKLRRNSQYQTSYSGGRSYGGGYRHYGGGNGGGYNPYANVPYYGGTNLQSQGQLPSNTYYNPSNPGIIRGSHPYSNNASTGGYTNGNFVSSSSNGVVGGLYSNGTGIRR